SLQYLVRFAHSSLKAHAPRDRGEESRAVVEHKTPCKNPNRARNGMETGTSQCASLYVKQKVLLTYSNLFERFLRLQQRALSHKVETHLGREIPTTTTSNRLNEFPCALRRAKCLEENVVTTTQA
ncbi:unnamed protein product, partial [Ixodes pacificus]